MKTIKPIFFILLVAFVGVMTSCQKEAKRADNVLKIYNWADYIDEERVLATFPKWYKEQTGEDIEIIYQTFELNETMLAEIEIGHEDYDLICPSEYIIERMLNQNLLLPIDKSIIPDSINYFGNVSAYAAEQFEKMAPDERTKVSDYAVGYMWGTTGFLYNPNFVQDSEVTTWGAILNERFVDKVFMKDAFRDVYSVLVQYAYKDDIASGDENREDLVSDIPLEAVDSVERLLLRAKQNIAAWEVDFGKEEMAKGKAWLNLLWSGDAQWAIDEAKEMGLELRYTVPVEGSNVWFDGWCIPKYAKNIKAATYFIDYMCREDNAIANMEEIGYVSVVATDKVLEWAIDEDFDSIDVSYFFGEEAKQIPVNPVYYPSIETIERCALMHDCADKTEYMLAMWSRVKGDNLNRFMIWSLSVLVLVLVVVIAVRFARRQNIGGIVQQKKRTMNNKSLLILCLMVLSVGSAYGEENALVVQEKYEEIKECFERRQKGTDILLQNYLKDYPYTPYFDEITMMTGILQTEQENYAQAKRTLTEVNKHKVSQADRYQCNYYIGYCTLMQEGFEECMEYFLPLTQKENLFKPYAIYYYAYANYTLQRYDEALKYFLEIEKDSTYQNTVPFYVAQIYYMKNDLAETQKRCEELLKKKTKNENIGEIHRILGEINYYKGEYRKAIMNLSTYQKMFSKKGKELVREDVYILGISNYHLKQYNDATQYLKMVKHQKDTISENTYLHLGHCYSLLRNKGQARLAYQNAYQIGITPTIKEEAMYNYILLSYPAASAFGENIQAFKDYLAQFPNSTHRDEIKELMVNSLVGATNYQAALEALEEIKDNNPRIQTIKQFLLYQIGADAFMQNLFEMARDDFELVIRYNNATMYQTDGYFWLSEISYRLQSYQEAKKYMEIYQKQSNKNQSPNLGESHYLDGYIKFQLRDYESAKNAFNQYVKIADKEKVTYADALNRLGDCYYNNRNFDKATNCYNQVIAMRATGADYATFQCGYSFGLMRQYKAKMNKMQNLVINYPNSDFADDALYELARAALESEDAKEAIKAYKQLFNSYPNSPLNCKASLEYAMIYHATRDFPNAIDAFKHTIETYSGTDEAYMALEGLQQVYIETNNINEYLVYSKKLPQLNMNVTSQEDSLIYITAELQYMKGNYEEAVKGLTSYINLFCSGGRHCTAAYYYTADSYYRLDEFDKALTHFQSLVKIQGNPFMEQAYTRMAEILFDKEDYQTAMFYFKKMQSIASNPSDRQVASIGVLRCSRNLNDNNTTIEIATDILTDNTIDDELRNEAMYSRAKAYLENNNSGLALGDLVYLAKEVRTSIGAESKYMLAQVYFNMNNIKQAEEEVMDFTQMNTSQQYWLAKSLILLSDIYVKKGDTFQAKQYLISLQNNYKKEDDIQLLVLEKIQQIDILEKPQPTNSSADDLSSETV